MNKTLIGFTGKIGSGKFYQMSKMVETWKTTGHSVFLTSYADPLKEVLRSRLGITKDGWMGGLEGPTKSYSSVHTTLMMPKFTSFERDGNVVAVALVDGLAHYLRMADIDVPRTDIIGTVTQHSERISELMGMMHSDYDDSFRQIIQCVGTEIGRGIDAYLWVKIAIARCQKALEETADVAFIDDIRFFNEYQELLKAGGLVYGVVASDETRAKRRNQTIEQMSKFDKHGSESSIDDIIRCLAPEFIIHND